MKSVREMGENAVVQRLLAQLPPPPADLFTGPGDDCAVVPFSASHWQLLKTDAIVEGIHFLPGENWERVGWKAIARVVSDFAAMGGNARWFLITLAVPPRADIDALEMLYRGMSRCAKDYQAHIVGGETTRIAESSDMVISIAATGFVKKSQLTLRSTARCGDEIFVTGRLGGSLAGRHLDICPRVNEAQWLCKKGFVSAMMDLSDGLAQDLPRLAQASNAGFQIDLSALPCQPGCTSDQALQDGEDYELLFTVSPHRAKSLQKRWSLQFPELALTRIGSIVPAEQSMELSGGWDHFAKLDR
jgi:thiamine-monophosphate kinase